MKHHPCAASATNFSSMIINPHALMLCWPFATRRRRRPSLHSSLIVNARANCKHEWVVGKKEKRSDERRTEKAMAMYTKLTSSNIHNISMMMLER